MQGILLPTTGSSTRGGSHVSILDEIITGVREDLERRKSDVCPADIEHLAREAAPAIDVVERLRSHATLGLFAEVKRSSPSKGALADIPHPALLAEAYESGGATAISVLTEERRFAGSLADLDAVRSRVEIPVLRKDFMVEDYQIFEARAHGADIVLLIVAALSDLQLQHLYALARSLDMRVLVEAHTPEEVDRALASEAELIGVNARNLKTLEVDLDYACSLLGEIPEERLAVGESAVATLADVEAYARAGADAVLVGEALVRHAEPTKAARDFRSVKRQGRARS